MRVQIGPGRWRDAGPAHATKSGVAGVAPWDGIAPKLQGISSLNERYERQRKRRGPRKPPTLGV